MSEPPEIRRAATPADWELFGTLVVEYGQWLGEDLWFQGFDDELAALAQIYGPPRGVALLAGTVGCTGLRPLDGDVCELKRMYVQEAARGRGLGRALAEQAIAEAHRLGYRAIRLDTLGRLTAAIALYESLGFVEIERYNDNPLDGVRYFELPLSHMRR